MANTTNNHDYSTPAQGTDDWHLPANANFENLDTDVEIRDQSGERGTYEAKIGAKFLSEDNGHVHLGDGSSWNFLGSLVPGPGEQYGRLDEQEEASARWTFPSIGLDDTDADGTGYHIREDTDGVFKVIASDGTAVLEITEGGTVSSPGGFESESGLSPSSSSTITAPWTFEDSITFPGDSTVTLDTEQYGAVSRPLMWDGEDRTIYCSPNGSADAAGTQSDPLTLQGAFESMPSFLNSSITVDLHTVPSNNGNLPATYNNGQNTYRPPYMYGLVSTADVRLRGNPDSPSEVVVENGLNWGCYGKGDSVVRGVQFHASVQVNGHVTVDRCNAYQKGNYGTPGVVLGIKKGFLKLKNCDLGEGNVGTVVNVTDNANVAISGGSLEASSGSTPLEGGPGTQFTCIAGASATSANGVDTPKGVGNMSDSELRGVISGQGVALTENNGRMVVNQGDTKEIYKAGGLSASDDERITGTWTMENRLNFNVEGNDVMAFSDASGGSNEDAFTYRYDTRGFRFWSGDDGSAPLILHTDGTISINGAMDDSLDLANNSLHNVDTVNLVSDPGAVFYPNADIESHVQSTGDADASAFNFKFIDDDSGVNRISWSRDAATGLGFRVWDMDSNTDLFTVSDDGTVEADGTPVVTSDDSQEIYTQSSEPASPTEGDIWIDTSS